MECVTACMIVPQSFGAKHPCCAALPVMKGSCSIPSTSDPILLGSIQLDVPVNCRTLQCQAILNDERPHDTAFEEYMPLEERPGFLERLLHAWHILFPRPKPISNAEIAKQRLKMILISDRCAVSDEAKRIIITNIVGALSDFVEIESEEKVQLNVSTDNDLGTVYSVTVPVRRVKPQYQDYERDVRSFKYREGFGEMRPVDIKFEYPDFRGES